MRLNIYSKRKSQTSGGAPRSRAVGYYDKIKKTVIKVGSSLFCVG